MAELLGIVSGSAGVASLLLQLGDSALKLKHFCGSYLNAPETLQDTVYEIETFQMLLQVMNNDRDSANGDKSVLLDRCVQICVKGVKRICTAVDKLEGIMQKHRIWGRLRTAAEERELKQLCDELDRATTSLVLAYQLYSEQKRSREALTRHSLLIQQIALQQMGGHNVRNAGSHTVSSEADSHRIAGSLSPPGDRQRSRLLQQAKSMPLLLDSQTGHLKTKRQQKPLLGIKLAPLFMSWILEVSLQQNLDGWCLSLRSSHQVPSDAPVFVFAERGDIEAIKTMFSRGLASPNVYREPGHDGYGGDLLTTSMNFGNADLFRYLYSLTRSQEHDHYDLMSLMPWRNWPENRMKGLSLPLADIVENDTSMHRLLVADMNINMEDVTEHARQLEGWLQVSAHSDVYQPLSQWFSYANSESLQVIKQALPEPYSDIPISVRFENAMSLDFGLVFDAECFLQAVGTNEVDEVLAGLESLSGQNAIHFVAQQLNNLFEMVPPARFVRELLEAGADLHKQDRFGCTPLQCYLKSQAQFPNWNPISLWANLLHSAGVDLVRYGEKEAELWKRYRILTLFDDEDATLLGEQLIFGPRPSDWDLLISETNVTTLYEYTPPPASWPIDSTRGLLPTMICWSPDEKDIPLLPWAPTRTIEHRSRTYFASHHHSRDTKELSRWQKAQDDTGSLALAMITRSSQSHPRRRHQSQPPLGRSCTHAKTYRQSYSYFKYPSDRVAADNDWLWVYQSHSSHVCDFGHGQRLVCMEQMHMSPARCIQYDGDKSSLWRSIDRNIQGERRRHLRRVKADAYKLEHGL